MDDGDMNLGRLVGLALLVNFTAQAESFYVSSGNEVDGFRILRCDSNGSRSQFSPLVGSWFSGMAIDRDGSLYASSINASAVYKFDQTGNATVFAQVDGACGLAFDGGGNLYVAGLLNHTITRVAANGNKSVFASAGLSNPYDLTFDGSGNLYVGNQGDDTIVRFDPVGNRSVFATGVYNPTGLACDGLGNLYVASASNIRRYTPAGMPTVFANPGYPNYGQDLAFGSNGTLYSLNFNVNDGSGGILGFNANGQATTIASGLERPSSFAVVPVPEPTAAGLFAIATVVAWAFRCRPAGGNARTWH